MMSNLLELAKEYQEKLEWRKAASVFEKYIEENKMHCSEEVYVSLSDCLSYIGDSERAETILLEGLELHSESVMILKKLRQLYVSASKKDEEISVAKSLVEINPEKANNYFLLGSAYASDEYFAEAKANYIIGLELKHRLTIEELTRKIQSGISENTDQIKSEYNFISGRNNYGAFIHNHKGRKYFTKISKNNSLAKREEVYYKQVREEFTELKEITPDYIDSILLDDIIYLTIEMIDNEPISSDYIQEALKTSNQISSIRYKDIVKKYPNPRYSFKLKNKPNPIAIFFTKIHKKKYNARMFSLLYELIEDNTYPSSVNNIIGQLESMVMNNRLYAYIDPKKHYSLIHGDFNQNNPIVDKATQTIKIIDWETFKIGLKTIDVARYFSSAFIPYAEVRKSYLGDVTTGGYLSLIEKVFFLYILILFYILTLREKITEKDLDLYINPALQDMRAFVFQLMKKEINDLSETAKKHREKVEQLEETVSRQTEQYRMLEKRYKGLVNSKSWKLTAPIRKISRLIQNLIK